MDAQTIDQQPEVVEVARAEPQFASHLSGRLEWKLGGTSILLIEPSLSVARLEGEKTQEAPPLTDAVLPEVTTTSEQALATPPEAPRLASEPSSADEVGSESLGPSHEESSGTTTGDVPLPSDGQAVINDLPVDRSSRTGSVAPGPESPPMSRTLLGPLLGVPIDDPSLSGLLQVTPKEVMQEARAIADAQGNPRQVLRLLVSFLVGQDLAPTFPPKKRNQPSEPPILNPWMVALSSHFYTPDVLDAAELIYGDLKRGVAHANETAKFYTPDGRPMPRKRGIGSSGGATSRRGLDHAIALAETPDEWNSLAARYPRFMLELGRSHYLQASLVNAYECMSRAMLLDFDAWREVEDERYEMFLESATFMVLSAHKTEQVMELYDRVPLKQSDLQQRIVDQIARRTEIYTRAKVEFSNDAAISQALVDLLNTLIEDPSIDEFLPPDQKRKFLVMVGDAALARRRYQEAIGVFTSLGEKRRLTEIGKQLSSKVVYENQGGVTISRDIDLAIDAFREAGDVVSLKDLLARCEETRQRYAGQSPPPANFQYLDRYIRSIQQFVSPGEQAIMLEARPLVPEQNSGLAVEEALTPERVRDLIAQDLQSVKTAVPGQDLASTKARLARLGEQALMQGDLTLGLEALTASDQRSDDTLLQLGRTLAASGKVTEAYEVLKAVGQPAYPDLIKLGADIVSRGLAPRGIFNPEVEIAVEIFLLTDEGPRLEALANDLLKLKANFAGQDLDSQMLGRAPVDRKQASLQRCLARIEEVYELVGTSKPESGASAPPPALGSGNQDLDQATP